MLPYKLIFGYFDHIIQYNFLWEIRLGQFSSYINQNFIFIPFREMNLRRKAKNLQITSIFNNKTCAFFTGFFIFKQSLTSVSCLWASLAIILWHGFCKVTVQTVNHFFRAHVFMVKFGFETCAIKHFTLFQNFHLLPLKLMHYHCCFILQSAFETRTITNLACSSESIH